ncbi:MAG: response regulator [Gammaproteobacteria bacterium]|nr:response regulator [Gammaproteobacteria bacterium]
MAGLSRLPRVAPVTGLAAVALEADGAHASVVSAQPAIASTQGVATAPDISTAWSSASERPLVVVVDDQSSGRRILEAVIRGIDAQLDVQAFADAAVALEQIGAQTPDLIVTDYLMPGLDGLDFIRRVRALPGCEDLPIIVVTIVEDRRVRYQALDAGATDFLSRPIDEQECRVRCRNLLMLRLSHQELRRRSEQLARLSKQLSLAEQRERKRLAQVIHDDLQQLLVAAELSLQRVGRRLPAGEGMEQLHDTLAGASDLLQQATGVARSLVGDLSPPILHEAGLVEALEWLARRMRGRYGLDVALSLDAAAAPASDDVRSVLFDAVREALFNVVKHAETDRVRLSLLRSGDARLRLLVEDDGVGFDGTARRDDSSPEEGFGLFSMGERLHMLGGQLRVASEGGRGTRVEITAPLSGDADLGGDGAACDSDVGAASSEVLPAPAVSVASPAPLRILLADDHAMMRRALSAMLAGEPGITVSGEASDGLEAIAEVERSQPDMVLMDVSMPRMDGLEATRRIKARWPSVQVIGLSMHEPADRSQAMLAAGAAAYLCKSDDVGLLLETIRRVSVRGASAAPPAGD